MENKVDLAQLVLLYALLMVLVECCVDVIYKDSFAKKLLILFGTIICIILSAGKHMSVELNKVLQTVIHVLNCTETRPFVFLF